jgi:hypothetical protein
MSRISDILVINCAFFGKTLNKIQHLIFAKVFVNIFAKMKILVSALDVSAIHKEYSKR